MIDVIEQLRAHDPERDGSAATPPVERVLARLAEEPEPRGRRRSSATHPDRSRWVAVAVALTCLAAVAVTAVAVSGIGGGRSDPLAGSDPIAGGDAIVHTVMRVMLTAPDGRRVPMQFFNGRLIGMLDGSVARWSAPSPARWRELTTLRPGRDMPGGTMDQSFADDIQRTHKTWMRSDDDLMRGTGSPQRGLGLVLRTLTMGITMGHAPEPTPLPRSNGLALVSGVADPRETVDMMLRDGEVRAAGTVTRNGRDLLRFVTQTKERQRGRAFTPAKRIVYLLDQQTYAPVEVMISLGNTVPSGVSIAPPGNSGGSLRAARDQLPERLPTLPLFSSGTVLLFDTYETIPLTADSARLLRMGGPTG